MKKSISIILSILCILSLVGCGKKTKLESETPSQDYFNAVVLEVNDDMILAECTSCESGAISVGNEVSVNMDTISSEEVPILNVGDAIRIVYIGEVMETDPARLENIISIFWIDENGEIVTEPVKVKNENLENPDWGIILTVENLTPSGTIIKCTQSGGEATGELHTGSWYILENWTHENGWKEMPYIIDGEIGWDDIAWIIPMNDTIELEVNWEWLYGKLPVGKYRIGKSITDFRESGDYDITTYFVEFEIEK